MREGKVGFKDREKWVSRTTISLLLSGEAASTPRLYTGETTLEEEECLLLSAVGRELRRKSGFRRDQFQVDGPRIRVVFVGEVPYGADDNGEGGTLALYSKLCSNSKIGLINKQFNAQVLVSSCESASNSTETSMLVGDGVLTPTLSVLTAVSGIRVKVPELNESAEAMFADLGHFSKLSLRMAFATLVYPSLVIAYLGEAAYISKHKENLQTSFYRSIPGKS
ncbi:hypothetical protein HPP92_026355 [Vanilla planifolia]|uniref:K+ potassium transporter integral membrane domain-containing protein n=1 Tax=Vanilla planifolia TaxID=51239 RepID=A0A835U6N0_VANPL|nr:hypothetical protein HPP92_026355 [Vanilla planifolia]